MIALPVVLSLLVLVSSDQGLRVTTESAEYCAALSHRVTLLRITSDAASALAEEGRRLCATGHVRSGIAKLRRALRASRQAEARIAG